MKSNGIIPQDAELFDPCEGYKSAAFEVTCFKTSHDSADSVGYIIDFHGEKFGICTDTGEVTEQAKAAAKESVDSIKSGAKKVGNVASDVAKDVKGNVEKNFK